jgi:hypothetical protein
VNGTILKDPPGAHIGTVNRSPLSRLSALLAAVFFFLAWGGEAAGLHACPHHGGVPAAHADASHHGGHDQAPAEEHGGCTCASGCPSAGGALLPPIEGGAGLRVAVVHAGPALFPRAAWAAPTVPPFFLPYAQGPPQG